MKKLIAWSVYSLATWAAVNAQNTKQFSGVYNNNGNATYTYYYDPETGKEVKHGPFKYTENPTSGLSYTITGSFIHGLRNGTWIFKKTANNAVTSYRVSWGRIFQTENGTSLVTINYKNGLFHGSFNATKNWSALNSGASKEYAEKTNIVVNLNFNSGKLTGSAYIKNKESITKGQFDNQSSLTGIWYWNDKDGQRSNTYKNGFAFNTDQEKQTYSNFEPYINNSLEELWENGFTVNKTCNSENKTTKDILSYIKYFTTSIPISGDLNDYNNIGGCIINAVIDWRGNIEIDSLPSKIALDQAIINQDKIAIVQNVARLDYKIEKVTNPAKMQRLQDSLFVEYHYILEELDNHYKSVNNNISKFSFSVDTWKAGISKKVEWEPQAKMYKYSFTNPLALPKNDNFKYELETESIPFRWDGNTSKYNSWVSRTKSEFLIGNFIHNYDSTIATIKKELYKQEGYIRGYNYYSFAFEETKDPAQSTLETIQSLLDLKEQEESIWLRSVVFSRNNEYSEFLKTWVFESANIPAYHVYETIKCDGCNTFGSNDELIKRIVQYKVSLNKIDSIYDILDSLCKVEKKLVVQQSELENQAASISKYPILNSSTELLIKGVSSALKSPKLKLEFAKLESCSEILTTAKAVLDQFNRAQADCDILNNAMGSYLAGAISFSQEIDSARAKSDLIVYSEYLTCYKLFEASVKALVTNSMSTPENLIQPEDYVEEINKRTLALRTLSVPLSTYLRSLIKLSLYLDGTKSAVANSGIKEYMSCYKVFESSLEPKITGGFTPPQSPTDVEDYMLEINNRTTTLTTEMEPFVLLQSVLSKPLTKENKKAIKGASKDPVALMAVLKTL